MGATNCNGNAIPDVCEPDCNNNNIADECDITSTFSADCSGNGIPDECEPDCNNNTVADSCDILGASDDCDLNGVPDECDLARGAPDCNSNTRYDFCDILLGSSLDANTNGTPDDCEVSFEPPQSPSVAPAPHNRRKNRYISFAPNNPGVSVAFRVQKLANPSGGTGRCTVSGNACTGGVAPPAFAQGTCAAGQSCISSYLTGNPGGACWVQTPVQTANPIPGQNNQYTAKCGSNPVFRVWTEPVVHVGDCAIIPASRYEIYANGAGPLENPVPLMVETALTPALNSKLWGDNVGINNGAEWTVPNGLTNVQDILSLLAIQSGAVIRPTFAVANLRGGSSADGCLNQVVSSSDVLAIVQAIAGASYGPPATAQPVNPALCPVCP